jgi:hypothetical protein
MTHKLDIPVSVSLTYDSKSQSVKPRAVVWGNKLYAVTNVGLHHTYQEGATLFHVFSVSTPTIFLRLVLNTKTLHWRLEEVYES